MSQQSNSMTTYNPLDNLRKSIEERRNATHCKRGHSEWRSRKGGGRYCVPCKHERQRISRGLKSGRLKHEFGLYAVDIQILELAAQGYTIQQAADKLFYTRQGIAVIRKRAKVKLGTDDFTHAIFLAYAKGVIE